MHSLNRFLKYAIVCCSIFISFSLQAQVIHTYAGHAGQGAYRDGDAATAQFNLPMGMAFDKEGNLYIVDGANNAIRRIDVVTKQVTTVLGMGNNYGNCRLSEARLTGPRGIAIDKAGNLYIADASTYIRKADLVAQTVTTIAGTRGVVDDFVGLGDGGPAINAHFDNLMGLAFDSKDNLYIADMLNGRIRRIDAESGIITTYAGNNSDRPNSLPAPTVNIALNQPLSLAFDSKDNLYLPNQGLIQKIDALTKEVTTLAGSLYNKSYSGDGGLAVNATMSPLGIAIDKDNNIIFADWSNQRVRKIDQTTGIITTIAGNGTIGYAGDCGPGPMALLNWPWSVATSKGGNVFFTELYNSIVREITNDKPNQITGSGKICLPGSATLENEATGGVWQSSNLLVAAVDNNGRVTGVSAGSANILYTVTIEGCSNTVASHTIAVANLDASGALLSQQTVCIGSEAKLTASAGNGIWTSSDPQVASVRKGDTMTALTSGASDLRYIPEGGCTVTDKVSLQVVAPQNPSLGNDTSFCRNTSFVLQPGSGFLSYKWSDGSAEDSLSIKEAGVYSVATTDKHHCTAADTVEITAVYEPSSFSWLKPSSLCEGSAIILSVPDHTISALWQDNSAGASYTVTRSGIYWVSIIDENGCGNSDTFVLNRVIPTPRHFLPADTALCSYETLVLAPNLPFANYAWSTGSTDASLTVNKSGLYSLHITDVNGCKGSDTIAISAKTCLNRIFFPTAFTPNGDGRNDRFRPALDGHLLYFTMSVFNRWGKVIYRTTDWNNGWDGTLQGIRQDAGSYIWEITYRLPGENKKTEKGIVVLVN